MSGWERKWKMKEHDGSMVRVINEADGRVWNQCSVKRGTSI